jgi:membrane fusion protein (multidrug efflux system)
VDKQPLTFKFILFLAFSSFIFCKKHVDPTTIPAGSSSQQKALPVEYLVVSPQSLSANIEVPGSVLANETTEIHPEISGRLTGLYIREGTNVAKGALLAKLNDGDLQAQLRKLEVQLKIAEETEKRQAKLLEIQGISQQDYDLSLLQVLNLKADMDIIQESIRKTEIRAPFSGKLGLKNVSPGAYVTPASILTTISQLNILKIQFNVPERYGPKLTNGMEVNFSVDGVDKNYIATILASEINIDETTRSLAIRALVKQPDAALIPGAFTKVRIVLGKNEDALMVPNSAIIPLGRTKQLYLYKAGKAMAAEVTTGVRDSSNIQVLTGIKTGDTVITSAILYLRPGLEVEAVRGELYQ